MHEKANKDREQDYFSQLVRERVGNYPIPVDDNCWAEIEQALISNRRKIPFWAWVSTAVAASLALLLLLRTYLPETPIEESTTTEQIGDFNKRDYDAKPEPAIDLVVSSENEKPVPSIKKEKQPLEGKTNLVAEKIQEKEVEEIPTEEVVASQNTETQSIQNEPKKYSFDKQISDWIDSDNEWEEKLIKKKRSKWLLAASFGSGSGSFFASDHGDLAYSDNVSGGAINGDFSSSNTIGDIFYPEEFFDATHYAPLSFGINIRKDINKHWAVESGLTYTYLLSTFSNSRRLHGEATMKMHYIGVPLNLVAYISNSNPRWNLYVSAGGMVEKGLQLDFTQKNRFNDGYIREMQLKEDISGWQCSLNASVGAGYKIYKDISLYLEPRIIYYLNNNQPESIRTKNPLIVGFNTGLRLEF